MSIDLANSENLLLQAVHGAELLRGIVHTSGVSGKDVLGCCEAREPQISI